MLYWNGQSGFSTTSHHCLVVHGRSIDQLIAVETPHTRTKRAQPTTLVACREACRRFGCSRASTVDCCRRPEVGPTRSLSLIVPGPQTNQYWQKIVYNTSQSSIFFGAGALGSPNRRRTRCARALENLANRRADRIMLRTALRRCAQPLRVRARQMSSLSDPEVKKLIEMFRQGHDPSDPGPRHGATERERLEIPVEDSDLEDLSRRFSFYEGKEEEDFSPLEDPLLGASAREMSAVPVSRTASPNRTEPLVLPVLSQPVWHLIHGECRTRHSGQSQCCLVSGPMTAKSSFRCEVAALSFDEL